MLTGIKIKNYALLQEMSLGMELAHLKKAKNPQDVQNLNSLNQFTVLIGQNSSGKTSFFEALDFLSNILLRDVQIAANKSKQGSYHNLVTKYTRNGSLLEFDLLFHYSKDQIWLRYWVAIAADHNYRPFIKNELVESYSFQAGVLIEEKLLEIEEGKGFVQGRAIDKNSKNNILLSEEPVELTERKISALSIFGRMSKYQELVWIFERLTNYYFAEFQNLPDLSRETIQSGGHKHLNRKASNIKNVLRYMREEKPKRYQALLKRLNDNLPSGNKIDLTKFDPVNGVGNLKLLIIYLILADKRPLIAFDEPDTGLHYDMLDALLVEMRDFSVRNPDSQLFIATHNPNVLDAFAPHEVWSFDRKLDKDNQPQISAHFIGDNKVVRAMYEEGVGLGSLWYSGYLDAEN